MSERNQSAKREPLANVRVINRTSMVIGPNATLIMADMGADVIKVEPPQSDDTRNILVGPAPGPTGEVVNVKSDKRGIVLDLKNESDKTALRELMTHAQIFAVEAAYR